MINFDFNSSIIRLSDAAIPYLENGINKIYNGNIINTTEMIACNINFALTKVGNAIVYSNFNIVSFNVLECDTSSGVFTEIDDTRITGDIDLIRQISFSGENLQKIYKIGVFGTKKYIRVNFVYNYSGTTINTINSYINYGYIPRETR